VLAVKELAAFGQVLSEVLVSQTQLIEDDGGPVSPEASAVKPNIEQPVGFVVGLFSRCIEEVSPFGVVSLYSNLCFQWPNLIQPEDLDAFGELQKRQRENKLAFRVVPEDDPMSFFIKQPGIMMSINNSLGGIPFRTVG